MSNTDLAALAAELKAKGVRALTVTWCDPTASSARAPPRSTSSPPPSNAAWAAPSCLPCSTPTTTSTGASRASTRRPATSALKAVPERIVQLAGQPTFAWAPGQLWLQEGPRWEHCYRAALERVVERAAGLGYEFKAGLELEWFIGQDSDEPVAAHRGPVYSPNAMLDVSEFVSELLADLDANGLGIGQIHAEYGWSQLELTLDAEGSPLGGRRSAARARDDPHRRARQRAARVVRTAGHARRRRQRLALPRLDPQGRPQPACRAATAPRA